MGLLHHLADCLEYKQLRIIDTNTNTHPHIYIKQSTFTRGMTAALVTETLNGMAPKEIYFNCLLIKNVSSRIRAKNYSSLTINESENIIYIKEGAVRRYNLFTPIS